MHGHDSAPCVASGSCLLARQYSACPRSFQIGRLPTLLLGEGRLLGLYTFPILCFLLGGGLPFATRSPQSFQPGRRLSKKFRFSSTPLPLAQLSLVTRRFSIAFPRCLACPVAPLPFFSPAPPRVLPAVSRPHLIRSPPPPQHRPPPPLTAVH